MRALAAAGIILAAAGGTSSCSGGAAAPATPAPVAQDSNNGDYAEKHILLSDGRTVTCLEWMSGSGMQKDARGGISCDWEHAEGAK